MGKYLDHHRIGKVRDGKNDNGSLVSDLARLDRKDLATDRHLADRTVDLCDVDALILKVSSVDHIRIVRLFHRIALEFAAEFALFFKLWFLFCSFSFTGFCF